MAADQLTPSNLSETERLLVWVLWRMGKPETNTGEIIRWYYNRCQTKIKADDIKECLAGSLSQFLLLFPSGRIKVRLGWEERFDALGNAVDDSRRTARKSTSTPTGITKQVKPKLQLLPWQQQALHAWNDAHSIRRWGNKLPSMDAFVRWESARDISQMPIGYSPPVV